MDKQIEGAVHHVIDDSVRTVDFIDDHNGLMAEGECLPEHEGGLGHRTFLGVDQNKHPIHHAERTLDLAAEVGVAGRIDDVNLHSLIRHTRVLGTDGDTPFTFLIHGIHDAFAHVVDLAMDMCLT